MLVLGAAGMLGHRLTIEASKGRQVVATVRQRTPAIERLAERYGFRLEDRLDAADPSSFEALIARVQPAVVVNAIGIVKQSRAAHDPIASIAVNALFPHQMARACRAVGARFVHVSTDCVFRGTRGPYREADETDADDLYGRSKALGEPDDGRALTLRTSIIGPELGQPLGLLGWVLSQRGRQVRGFRRALFSGLTTLELARMVLEVVEAYGDLAGVWHVTGDAISKHDLLQVIDAEYALGLEILPDDEVRIDRRLDGTAFRERTGYAAAPWPALVAAMRGAAERDEDVAA